MTVVEGLGGPLFHGGASLSVRKLEQRYAGEAPAPHGQQLSTQLCSDLKGRRTRGSASHECRGLMALISRHRFHGIDLAAETNFRRNLVKGVWASDLAQAFHSMDNIVSGKCPIYPGEGVIPRYIR